MRFVALEKLINLHDGYRREFRIDHYLLLLLQLDGDRYLVGGTCPHQEHRLFEGWVGEGCIECPLHNYKFSLTNGQLLHATEEQCGPLKIWQLEYEGSDVGVLWSSFP